MAAQGPRGFEQWFRSLPVITRTYLTGCVLTTLAVHLDLVNPLNLYLNFQKVVHQRQLWLLVTNFFFFDNFSLNFIFHLFFLVRHSRLLEEGSFRGRTADYFFMLLFCATLLIGIDYVFFLYSHLFPRIMFLGFSLEFAIVYVWSKRNPDVRLSFLGLFTFQAPWLAWVILSIGMLFGQSPINDLIGIVVGHVYYYLEDVYPRYSGRRLLRTPGLLKALFPNDNVGGGVPLQEFDDDAAQQDGAGMGMMG